jgi:Tol biopolymer transport system component
MRSLLMVMWIWVMVSCGGSGGDSAAVPGTTPAAALPANQLVFNSNRSGNHEIFTMQTDGSGARQLTKDARYDNWWPRISPDRTKVLFYRAPAGKSESYADASLWVVGVDGSGLTLLRDKGESGWTQQGHAEWSPDTAR